VKTSPHEEAQRHAEALPEKVTLLFGVDGKITPIQMVYTRPDIGHAVGVVSRFIGSDH